MKTIALHQLYKFFRVRNKKNRMYITKLLSQIKSFNQFGLFCTSNICWCVGNLILVRCWHNISCNFCKTKCAYEKTSMDVKKLTCKYTFNCFPCNTF